MVALGPGLAARRFLVPEISRLSVGYARLKKRSSSRKDPLGLDCTSRHAVDKAALQQHEDQYDR